MAHEISSVSGRAEIAYCGTTPWHGLGTKVDGLQTADAMLAAAGLTWTVSTQPLYLDGGILVPSHVAIRRDDTGVVLGVASTRWAPIQNSQAAGVTDALVTEGGAHVEVAGALGQGERCWMLAHIPGDFEVVKGDQIRPYFLLAWGHDGKHGLAGKLTTIRVVCNNTLTAAGFGKGQKWSESADIYVRHTKGAALQIEAARTALGIAKKQVEQTADAYRLLAATSLTEAVAANYFASVFPTPERAQQDDEGTYQERLARWTATQDKLAALYQVGVGSDIPGVRGTAWAAYNAITEWADHVYPVLQSGQVSTVRQQSVAFGAYGEVKARALAGALALAG
jgi:phage/plasmid-like protein (TIGR03299 family)